MSSKESIAVILGSFALGLSKTGSKSTAPINLIKRKKVEHIASSLTENQFLHFTNGFPDIDAPRIYRNSIWGEPFTLHQESLVPDMGLYITKDYLYGGGYAFKNSDFLCIVEAEDDKLFPDEDWLSFRILEELHCKWSNKPSKQLDCDPKDKELSNTYISIGERTMDQYGDVPLPFLGDKTFKQLLLLDNIYLDWSAPFGIRANKVMTENERMLIIKKWREGKLERYGGMSSIYPNEFFIPDPKNEGIEPVKIYKLVD